MLPLINYLRHPKLVFLGLLIKYANLFPDKLYLQLRYFFEFGSLLDLKHPKTFNEKIQWLKLYNRRPEYTQMVDKYLVKDYVSKIIGSEYIIPTLHVWNSIEEIEFESLPNKFVLKTTHGGGGNGVFICKDKSNLDKNECLNKIKKGLNVDIYTQMREWPYKNISRRIIAEQFMEDKNNDDLVDYKFFCFSGTPKLCQVISDRRTEEKIDFYDMEWNRIPYLVGLNPKVKNSQNNHKIPSTFRDMKEIAEKLSKNIPFVRIDLYEINGKCYFGEITFFPAGGFGIFRPERWNNVIGDWIYLPELC